MLAQPHLEVEPPGTARRMLQCSGRGPANADFDKVPAKEPGTVDGVVVATPSLGARTSTGAQVLTEHREINVASGLRLARAMTWPRCAAARK